MRGKRLAHICMPIALLVSIWTAPAAPAAEFKSTASPVNFYGLQAIGQEHAFKVDGQQASCPTASYESEGIATPAKTLSVSPFYGPPPGEMCTVFGFISNTSKIAMNGCTYEFLQPNAAFESNLAIRCPTGKTIEIFGETWLSTCEVRIGESGNTNLAKVYFTNLGGAPTKVEATFSVTGMTANKVKDNGFCPLSGTGSTANVTYTGKVTFEGRLNIGVSVG